jgi:hypothetical protein
MYIKPKKLSWGKSPDADVVGYKIRWALPADPIEYDPTKNAGFDAGNVTSVDLPVAGMPNIDGELKIGLTAVDDVGNESDPAEGVFPFDFAPPAPPTGLFVS